MSLKPGLGAGWYQKYHQDIYRHDYLVVDGRKHSPPSYYDTLRKRQAPDAFAQALELREERAIPHRADQAPHRLAAKAAVNAARLTTLKRSFE